MQIKSILVIFLLIISLEIYAHPHSQILTRSNFIFENNNLKGVWSEWEFDAYFSSDIILSFDVNEDSKFDEHETLEIYNNAFISLENYNYFTFLRVGDVRTTPENVENLSVYIDDNGFVVYKFYIPLEYLSSRDFYLSIYDFTYFCACFYQEENPVLFTNSGDLSPEYSIDKNEDYPIYFDPYAGPNENTVHTEWKKGLNKLLIKEIHVKY